MEEIVKKLVSGAAGPGSGGVPSSLQPEQDRELRISLVAENLDGMRKKRELNP